MYITRSKRHHQKNFLTLKCQRSDFYSHAWFRTIHNVNRVHHQTYIISISLNLSLQGNFFFIRFDWNSHVHFHQNTDTCSMIFSYLYSILLVSWRRKQDDGVTFLHIVCLLLDRPLTLDWIRSLFDSVCKMVNISRGRKQLKLMAQKRGQKR